jgi:hypothetical protein
MSSYLQTKENTQNRKSKANPRKKKKELLDTYFKPNKIK